jgi:microcompartment protein CcmL/EutN
MKQALGLVEIQGLSTAVLVADTMVKAANVTILEIENSKGQGYMTVKIAGDVGAVNAAVSAGKQTGLENQKLVSFKVIARPADSVDQIFGAAKNTKTDASSQQSDSSAEVQMQTEKEDVIAGEPSVKEDIKETIKPEVEDKSEVEPEVKPEVQLEEKLEEKPSLVETEAEKPAQESQSEPQVELQSEPENASSVNPSGAKKTAGNKTKK